MNDVAQTFIAQARSYLSGDYLPKIERCLEKLSDEQVWWRANPESNSIGNLLLHLSGNVRQWIVSGIGGAPDARVRQQEFDERSMIPRAELLGLLKQTLSEFDDTLASLDPSLLLKERRIQGNDVVVLEAIFHVVEHFSMHTGQIILLTKMFKSMDLEFYDFTDDKPKPTWERTTDDRP
jgi:uncharacterized damage-inducible protein DinB